MYSYIDSLSIINLKNQFSIDIIIDMLDIIANSNANCFYITF